MDKINDIQVAPGKVLVKMYIDQELVEKAKSLDKILVTPEQKKEAMINAVRGKIGSATLAKCMLVNLGEDLNPKMKYRVGEYIYVFPNTYDADFVIDEVGYYIYSERNILAKINGSTEPSKLQVI